jgi:predicted RNA-binding Zn-ribbon protein involved in translation (DUF1610 family)
MKTKNNTAPNLPCGKCGETKIDFLITDRYHAVLELDEARGVKHLVCDDHQSQTYVMKCLTCGADLKHIGFDELSEWR